MVQERQQNDDRNRNAEQPKQNTATHDESSKTFKVGS